MRKIAILCGLVATFLCIAQSANAQYAPSSLRRDHGNLVDARGKGGAARRHGADAEHQESDAGDGVPLVGDFIPSLPVFVVGGAGCDGEGGSRQGADEAGAQADGAAGDELAACGVLLAGAADGVFEEVDADGVDQFAVGEGPAALVDETGSVAVDLVG